MAKGDTTKSVGGMGGSGFGGNQSSWNRMGPSGGFRGMMNPINRPAIPQMPQGGRPWQMYEPGGVSGRYGGRPMPDNPATGGGWIGGGRMPTIGGIGQHQPGIPGGNVMPAQQSPLMGNFNVQQIMEALNPTSPNYWRKQMNWNV
jgi:hypothetical protein